MVEVPVWLRRPCFWVYAWLCGCRLEEATVSDLQHYHSLSEFFRRSLKPGIRPVASSSELTSPADGRVIFYGKVIDGALEQIKGITYSLHGFIGPRTGSLLTFSSQDTELLDLALLTNSYLDHGAASLLMNPGNCLYQCLVYLSPGEYHHFHSPADWVVTGRRHFPGELFSVNPGIVRWLQGLFNFNERVLYVGNWKHGFFSFTAVGATLVGSIYVHFDKDLSTNEATTLPCDHFFDKSFIQNGDAGVRLTKGEEMGEFRLGSTIVLLFEAPPDFRFRIGDGQNMKYGEALAGVIN